MRIDRLSFKNYRNLKDTIIEPSDGINVIYGDNAQGKTNILEAMWLFTGGRSFRGSKDGDLVSFFNASSKNSQVDLDFFAFERQQNAKIIIEKGVKSSRKAFLNGVNKGNASNLIGCFCSVIFSPVHLSLIKDGPSKRRKFIDAAICQLNKSYVYLLSKYNRTLNQRNNLLKNFKNRASLNDTLDIWDYKLSDYGAKIILKRLKYCNLLKKYSLEIHKGISDNKESFDIIYKSTAFDKSTLEEDKLEEYKIFEFLQKKIKKNRENDIYLGYTSVGPHRDDILIIIDDKSVKDFGSQGQQRTSVLALKLSEASILRDNLSEKPVILLDDVMSELDVFRQDYILNHIDGWQVFITCCDPLQILRLKNGKSFEVKNGVITKNEKIYL